MDDPGISMADLFLEFGKSVPQAVFDFIGSNESGLTVPQKRALLQVMARTYYQGICVGRQVSGADEAERILYEELDRLAQRIRKLEKNV